MVVATPPHVWIVEKDPLDRARLALGVSATGAFTCSGHFADADSAMNALQRHDGAPPDLLIVSQTNGHDAGHEGAGFDGLRRLRARLPGAGAIVRTLRVDAETILDALRMGTNGCVGREDPVDTLLDALHVAMGGGVLLTPPAARSLRALFDGEPARYGLTPRERDVLRLMADGLQQKEIAARLHVSLATVTSHVHHLYAKLGVGTAAGAVARALRERLI